MSSSFDNKSRRRPSAGTVSRFHCDRLLSTEVDQMISRTTHQRKQWLAAISGSFHQVTVWMACCDHRSEVKDLLLQLQHEMPRFLKRVRGYIQAPRIEDWYKQFVGALMQLDKGYTEILDWLRLQHVKHDGCGSWVNPDLQDQKELYIKKLVVFNHYRKLFRNHWRDFEELGVYFEDAPRIHRRKVKRRRSISGYEKPSSASVKQRLVYEHMLRNLVVNLEKRITDGLIVTHQLYDWALLFEWYLEDVTTLTGTVKLQAIRYEMRYTFPEWKMKDLLDSSGPFWCATGTTKPVPTWDKDDDLRRYFP